MVVVPEGSYGRLWEDTPTSWWTGFHVDDTPGYGPPITSSRITVTDYYRFRSTQLSLDDYRAVDRSGLGLLFFRLRKLFGLDGPNLYWSDPSLLEVIDPGDIDNAAVTTAISTAAAEAEREGLQFMLWYRIPQLLPGVSAGAMFLSPCRRFTATAAAAKLVTQPAQPLAAGFGCASQRPGGCRHRHHEYEPDSSNGSPHRGGAARRRYPSRCRRPPSPAPRWNRSTAGSRHGRSAGGISSGGEDSN